VRFPVVLGVDVEPDPRYPDPSDPAPWRGFERVVPFMQRLRGQVTTWTGEPARFAWTLRMDPQIDTVYGSPDWVVRAYARELEALRSRGDRLGVHPHPLRWDDSWIMDHGNPDWIRHTVETSFATFRSALGEPCILHRAGDRVLTPDWLRLVARLGAEVDLSIEPGEPGTDTVDRGARWTGSIPDYSFAPREAYRPAPGRVLEPGGDRLATPVILPLTSTRVPRSDRRRAAPGALPPGPPHRPLVLWHCEEPRELWDVASARLDEMSRPYLAFMFRSDIPFHEPEWRRLRRVLAALRHHPIRRRIAFVTPDEAAAAVAA
jgi:hypothetical protein